MHHRSRHLFPHRLGSGMAVAALSRTTEARARVPQRDSSHPGAISVIDHCSSFCCRSVVAKPGATVLLVQGHLRWACLSAHIPGCSMALCQFPYVAGLAQLGFWNCLFCLCGSCWISVRSL